MLLACDATVLLHLYATETYVPELDAIDSCQSSCFQP